MWVYMGESHPALLTKLDQSGVRHTGGAIDSEKDIRMDSHYFGSAFSHLTNATTPLEPAHESCRSQRPLPPHGAAWDPIHLVRRV